MTTSQLKDRINTQFAGHGHFKVTIDFRGKEYSCTTTDTMAIDRIGDDTIDKKRFYVSEKQALTALWNECKRKNDL
jgi:hypothetical protein